MTIQELRRSKSLLKEIEEPTESLVTEGCFLAMLIHQENRPPTQDEVFRAMYALDGIDPEDDVEGRIADAIVDGTVTVRFDDERGDFLLFPADVREWWKVTMRYLINYMDDLELVNANRKSEGRSEQHPDKFHDQLISTVLPHMPKMVSTNQLPTCYPWEEE